MFQGDDVTMSAESRFLTLLRLLAHDPAAQGLIDDVAILPVGAARLILTSDTMVEGVHYLPTDPPADIGWKLAAVNLSDLAAKGARPIGCLLNYALSGDEAWDAAFIAGLGEALDRHAMPLLGGDTVAMPLASARSPALGRDMSRSTSRWLADTSPSAASCARSARRPSWRSAWRCCR